MHSPLGTWTRLPTQELSKPYCLGIFMGTSPWRPPHKSMADVYNCELPFPPWRMEGWSECLLVLIVAWIDNLC